MEKITKPAIEIYKDAPNVAIDFYLKIEGAFRENKGEEFVETHQDVIVELADVAVNYYVGEMRAKALKELAEIHSEAALQTPEK